MEDQGAMIRSRARWFEEGERSTKYFLNMERRNFNNKCISRLKSEDNQIIEDKNQILGILKQFYSKLYLSSSKNNETDIDNFFKEIKGPKLSEDKKKYCEGPITENELKFALMSVPNNKTPGNDGYSAEFYKFFWEEIKVYLLNSINDSGIKGYLSVSLQQGVKTLLPKKDKDPLLVKNWRPISLLNMEYKLIAKCLAIRVKKVMGSLINLDQTGFLEGRYISENINKILSILQQTEKLNLPAILLTVDFEKAYDYLEWAFIEKTLNFFNFGPSYLNWVKVLYKDCKSTVINNGWMSEFFTVSRGVRQGCPLCPCLFVMAAEILALKIRQNPNIQGVEIGNITSKIIQYADDTCLPLKFEEESLNEVIHVFQEYKEVSGLRVNYDKTEILRIGSIRKTEDKLKCGKNMRWTNQFITMLCVKITTEWDKLYEINYFPIIDKIKNYITLWSQRKLTAYGKITVIKSFLASQLVYMFSVLPCFDTQLLNKVEQLFYQFLWDGKPDKIKRRVIIGPVSKGGLKMMDVKMQSDAVKLNWVKRWRIASESEVPTWKCLAENNFRIKSNLIWECNINIKDVGYCLESELASNVIWPEIISTWSRLHFHNPKLRKEVLGQVLWLNSHIRVEHKPILYSDWLLAGVISINDVFDVASNKFIRYETFCEKFNFKPTF